MIPLVEVAAIVREWPTLSGYSPHIAARFNVPLGTARRWVYLARKRGLIGPPEHPCPTCNGTGRRSWGSGRAAPSDTPTDAT